MKITQKVINQLGGLPLHHTEGGGCWFHFAGGEVNITAEEMPKALSNLAFVLMGRAYLMGIEEGKRRLQNDINKVLGRDE